MNVQDFILDPKDAQRILIGASGKLGPMEFARGLVAIVAVSLALSLLSLLPVIGGLFALLSIIIGLALVFCWVCIFSKRFHDAGQSGWMTLAAVLVAIVLSVVVGLILTPIFGAAVYTDLGSFQAMSSGIILKNMITNIIVNGALGYYMFKLKSVMI